MTDYSRTMLVFTGLCLFLTFGVNASPNKNCTCRGPTNYYKEIGCAPVFVHADDCCPIRYNCDVLHNLKNNQCLVSGYTYNMGERLLPRHTNPCDWSCTCEGSFFSCMMAMCISSSYEPPCHLVRTDQCCGDQVVCPKADGTYATCTVDGKTYKDGELFVPAAEPNKRCYCAPGYTGQNNATFCQTAQHTWCSNVIYDQSEIRNCAPSYSFGESLQSGCNSGFRCPDSTDVVIRNANAASNVSNTNGIKLVEDSSMLCKFGNLTLRVGEELNEVTSSCLKCVCEVPPILSCQSTRSREACLALQRS